MPDKDLNQRIREQAEPGVEAVIEWALRVHADTMDELSLDPAERLKRSLRDQLSPQPLRFTLDEREEARQILLDYGAGKPARIVIHKGSKKNPICFNTVVGVPGQQKQLTEPDTTIDAEFTELSNEQTN